MTTVQDISFTVTCSINYVKKQQKKTLQSILCTEC